jgi:hypothetical protein
MRRLGGQRRDEGERTNEQEQLHMGVPRASVGNCTVSCKSFADKELPRLSNVVKVPSGGRKRISLTATWGRTILLADGFLG